MPLAEVHARNEHHLVHRSGWLRAAVLGANDGLVSTASLMIGVAILIGVAKPMNIFVDTYGTAKVNMHDGDIAKKIEKLFDMRPYGIESRLKLRNPIYSETAAYGHMGRKNEVVTKVFNKGKHNEKKVQVELFTWEKLDFVSKIKKEFGIK